MANELFSRRIKYLRKLHELSMVELAEKLDVKKSRVSMWENNGVVPREDILIRLSQFYGVSIDYLLGNDAMAGCRPEETRIIEYIKMNLRRLDDDKLLKTASIFKKALDDFLKKEDL